MKCWTCEHYGNMTEAENNGVGPGYQGWEEPWCNKWNSPIEGLKDDKYDIANCEHYEMDESHAEWLKEENNVVR